MSVRRRNEHNSTDVVLPSTVVPRGTAPAPLPAGPRGALGPRTHPVTIVPPIVVDRASRHGSIVVATLVSSTKLFDVVVKTTGFEPVTTLSQLTALVTGSWIFYKATLDLLATHGVERELVIAAKRDTAILVRAVVLLLIRRIVKLDGFSRVGDVLALFQFVKVGAAIAESQFAGKRASQFLNDVASIPMKVFSAVATLVSDEVDTDLRNSIALAIGSMLKQAQKQLSLLDTIGTLTSKTAERLFYDRYGRWTRVLDMQLGVPRGVDAREVLLEWKRSV